MNTNIFNKNIFQKNTYSCCIPNYTEHVFANLHIFNSAFFQHRCFEAVDVVFLFSELLNVELDQKRWNLIRRNVFFLDFIEFPKRYEIV